MTDPWEIYVMSNPAMPGLVKVGGSVSATERAIQLSQSSSAPLPFRIEFSQWCAFGADVERGAHCILSAHRVNERREFFRVGAAAAIHAVQVAALMAAWNRAGADARRDFLAQIDGPVFDRVSA